MSTLCMFGYEHTLYAWYVTTLLIMRGYLADIPLVFKVESLGCYSQFGGYVLHALGSV